MTVIIRPRRGSDGSESQPGADLSSVARGAKEEATDFLSEPGSARPVSCERDRAHRARLRYSDCARGRKPLLPAPTLPLGALIATINVTDPCPYRQAGLSDFVTRLRVSAHFSTAVLCSPFASGVTGVGPGIGRRPESQADNTAKLYAIESQYQLSA